MSVKPTRVTASTLSILLELSRSESKIWGLELVRRTGLKTGTVYPILARLESLGWATSSWELNQTHKGPRRRLWELTKDGKNGAAELLKAENRKNSSSAKAIRYSPSTEFTN